MKPRAGPLIGELRSGAVGAASESIQAAMLEALALVLASDMKMTASTLTLVTGCFDAVMDSALLGNEADSVRRAAADVLAAALALMPSDQSGSLLSSTLLPIAEDGFASPWPLRHGIAVTLGAVVARTTAGQSAELAAALAASEEGVLTALLGGVADDRSQVQVRSVHRHALAVRLLRGRLRAPLPLHSPRALSDFLRLFTPRHSPPSSQRAAHRSVGEFVARALQLDIPVDHRVLDSVAKAIEDASGTTTGDALMGLKSSAKALERMAAEGAVAGNAQQTRLHLTTLLLRCAATATDASTRFRANRLLVRALAMRASNETVQVRAPSFIRARVHGSSPSCIPRQGSPPDSSLTPSSSSPPSSFPPSPPPRHSWRKRHRRRPRCCERTCRVPFKRQRIASKAATRRTRSE